MLSRFVVFALALPLLTTATPWGTTSSAPQPTSKSCNTGPVQCCDQVQSPESDGISELLALLGVVLDDINVPIGLTCDPLNIIGISGTSCSGQTVCCENNGFSGIIAIGCTPINIGL